VLGEMTLYGLPMLHLEFPSSFRMMGPEWMRQEESAEARLATRVPVSDTTGLRALRVSFDLPLASPEASRTITAGTYFGVNEEIEAVAGMPIMPRTSVSVTLPGEYARGAFF
jgi:hypothetical protein